jgi:hypothetical protein
MTNVGNAAVNISKIAVTGVNVTAFGQTNTCPATLNTGSSCTISVTFGPAAKGKLVASISVTDNGGGSPQRVTLAGTGI